mmetsp:Transcript_3271/g.13257  ORF Transcript_3271/g.13257 Transcript_3271/m.13257 type:complete len:407 (-) Transcript_3271:8-1228(-)
MDPRAPARDPRRGPRCGVRDAGRRGRRERGSALPARARPWDQAGGAARRQRLGALRCELHGGPRCARQWTLGALRRARCRTGVRVRPRAVRRRPAGVRAQVSPPHRKRVNAEVERDIIMMRQMVTNSLASAWREGGLTHSVPLRGQLALDVVEPRAGRLCGLRVELLHIAARVPALLGDHRIVKTHPPQLFFAVEGHEAVPPALAALHHDELTVARVGQHLKLIDVHLVPPHEEDAQRYAVRYHNHSVLTFPLAVLAGCAGREPAHVDVREQRVPEASHAVVHIGGALAVWEAEKEATECQSLPLEQPHGRSAIGAVRLQVAKILLTNARLFPHASDAAHVERLAHLEHGLLSARVRRDVEVVQAVLAGDLTQLLAGGAGLLAAARGERHAVVGRRLVHRLVDVPQ